MIQDFKYSSDSKIYPFWAKSADFIRGRDALGIQNSSISLYSKLLPGMTNLTLRLRYYGFYLWLLKKYDELDSNSEFKKSARGQFNFIRRAELILAYYMVNFHKDEQGVIGINFVTKNIDQHFESGSYNIQKGADKNKGTVKNSVYWDFNSGAFGQYYVGSLISLGLVLNSNQNYFRHSDTGLELANAFAETISFEEQNIFLNAIKNGKLTYENLSCLQNFALNKPLNDSTEKYFYEKILFGNDGDNYTKRDGSISEQRKQTISLFLQYQNNSKGNAWFYFPQKNYSKLLQNDLSQCRDAEIGWYLFYLNEQLHYSLETIFWGMLRQMSIIVKTTTDFIDHIQYNTVINLNEKFIKCSEKSLDSFLQNPDWICTSSYSNLPLIRQNIKMKEDFECIAISILTIITIFHENKSKLELLKKYAIDNEIYDKNGNVLLFFIHHFGDLNVSVNDFIKKIIKCILNDHTIVAYKKMGNNDKNLLKFILEDNYLIHIETMEPNFTSPRLRTLLNFLIDLGLLSKDGLPTQHYVNYI